MFDQDDGNAAIRSGGVELRVYSGSTGIEWLTIGQRRVYDRKQSGSRQLNGTMVKSGHLIQVVERG